MFNIRFEENIIATVDTFDGIAVAVAKCAHDYIRREGATDAQYLHRVIDMFVTRNDYKYIEELLWTVFGVSISVEYAATGEPAD